MDSTTETSFGRKSRISGATRAEKRYAEGGGLGINFHPLRQGQPVSDEQLYKAGGREDENFKNSAAHQCVSQQGKKHVLIWLDGGLLLGFKDQSHADSHMALPEPNAELKLALQCTHRWKGEGRIHATCDDRSRLVRKTTEAALVTYLAQVSNALHEQAQAAQVEAQESGDEAKIAAAEEIENRGNLIGTLQETISENGIDWTNEVPFGGGSDALVSQAESTIGTQEGSEADALVGVDTASIPWCGAFVKAMCEKSGQPLPENANWNVAETYVSPEGSTGEHVAIYAGNGEMVGGNQSNAVTRTSLPGNFRFNTVENLIAGRQVDLSGQQEPQPGDIIVTSRGDGNSDSTDTAATTSTV